MEREETISQSNPDAATIDVVGVPIDHGGAGSGQADGPAALRAAGITTIPGRTVVDHGDLDVPPLNLEPIKRGPDPESRRPGWDSLRHICRVLHEQARASVERGSIPLALGGDHTTGEKMGYGRHPQGESVCF